MTEPKEAPFETTGNNPEITSVKYSETQSRLTFDIVTETFYPDVYEHSGQATSIIKGFIPALPKAGKDDISLNTNRIHEENKDLPGIIQ